MMPAGPNRIGVNLNAEFMKQHYGLRQICTNANISNITLTLNRNDSFFQKSSISTEIPLIKNLKTDDKCANMVADKLEIKKVKVLNLTSFIT